MANQQVVNGQFTQYHLQNPEKLNQEFLINNKNFQSDATAFLIDRAGYEADDLKNSQDVYNGFMQHFRRQNVNELTAVQDLIYAQSQTDDKGRARMGRLMNTFDHMDGELGWKAAGDYLGGVFTAPSTYAGIFSFGTAKAGALAAQQGVKFGIRQALKGAARGAVPALAIDAPVAAGTIAAQEQIRKDTGIKEEGEGIDFSKVGTGAAISAVTSGLIGGGIGARQAYTGYTSELALQNTLKQQEEIIEKAHVISEKILKTKGSVSKKAQEFKSKLALKETIPEALEKGKELKKDIAEEQLEQSPIKGLGVTLDEKTLDNIAVAGAKIFHEIKPRVLRYDADGNAIRAVKGSKEDLQERFSSRVTRGLLDSKTGVSDGALDKVTLTQILKDHNVSLEQLGYLYAEEVSRAGKVLKGQSVLKSTQKELFKEMNEIDASLMEVGSSFTAAARRRVSDEKIGLDTKGMVGNVINQVFGKGRVGLMTIQFATTARNTTNGYMRNYVYGLDNLGAGLYNVVGGNINKLRKVGDEVFQNEARRAVRMGVAQLKTSADAFRFKDLVLGTTSTETAALDKLFRNPAFGKSEQAKELFKEMGDIGNLTGTEGGLVALARRLNVLNTYSDNMFKRAIFSRELNKLIQENQPGMTLAKVIEEGRFPMLSDRMIADATEAALDFTYQTGKFHTKEGWFNNKLAAGIIQFGSSTAGSFVVPFPRYLVNQFRFVYEHAPILGMFDLGSGILNKSKMSDRVGKQFGGLVTLYAFLQMRANLGTEDTGAFEYANPAGQGYFDARASLGPFGATAVLADLIYRMMPHQNKETYKFEIPFTDAEIDTKVSLDTLKLKENPRIAKGVPFSKRDMIYALTGGTGRGGTGLDIIDGAIDIGVNGLDLDEEKWQESMVKFLANGMNTYTVGAGVFKDIVATIDPDFRKLPNNTDVSLLGYLAKQATRAFPQTTDPNVDGLAIPFTEYRYTGIGPQREGISETPYRTGGVTYQNPLLKQLTGLSLQQQKTYAQKEFDRLRFDYREVAPRKIKLDTALTNDQKGEMAKDVESKVAKYISTDIRYNKAPDFMKREFLKNQISIYRALSRKNILDPNRAGANVFEIKRLQRAKFYDLPKPVQKYLNKLYSDRTEGGDIVKDKMFGTALSDLEYLKENQPKLFQSFTELQVKKGDKTNILAATNN